MVCHQCPHSVAHCELCITFTDTTISCQISKRFKSFSSMIIWLSPLCIKFLNSPRAYSLFLFLFDGLLLLVQSEKNYNICFSVSKQFKLVTWLFFVTFAADSLIFFISEFPFRYLINLKMTKEGIVCIYPNQASWFFTCFIEMSF